MGLLSRMRVRMNTVENSDAKNTIGERSLRRHKRLTFRYVLKAMQYGIIEQVLQPIPDEFLTEARAWIREIEQTLHQIKTEVYEAFYFAPKNSRTDFAVWVDAHYKHLAPYLFAMLDGCDLDTQIYLYHDWGHPD